MSAVIPLLLLGAVAVVLSLRLPVGTLRAPDSGFFPLVLGTLLVVLAVAHGAQLWRRHRHARVVPPAPAGAAPAQGGAEGGRRAGGAAGRVLAFLGIVAGSTLLLKPVGYVTAGFLLMVGLLRLLGVRRWSVSGVLALACAAAAHLVFVRWLRIPLPVGPMGF
jgi:hypothetical protein